MERVPESGPDGAVFPGTATGQAEASRSPAPRRRVDHSSMWQRRYYETSLMHCRLLVRAIFW